MTYSTRRDWVFGAMSSVAWAAVAAAQDHAHTAVTRPGSVRLDFFDESTAADVGAIASQILPSEDGPGAKEAGVIFFIDRALTTFDIDKQPLYRRGIEEARAKARQMFPESTSIAGLDERQQIELLRTLQTSEFFETIRVHTVLGFLGSPSYGGNREKVGWKYIGFEDRMTWQPPFGYYDSEAK